MSGPVPSPDLFLARRAAAGQEDAWAELIDRHGRRLYNLALQFSGSREEAEDLTQEIFIRLFQNLRSYRGEVPLLGWALRLSRNLCIDHYRKTRHERGWHRVASEVLDHLPSGADTQATAERREYVEAVYSGLSQIQEEHAEAVMLCDLQGLSMEEASAYLDVPLGTLKSRLHRARQCLTEVVRAQFAPAVPFGAGGEAGAGEAGPC